MRDLSLGTSRGAWTLSPRAAACNAGMGPRQATGGLGLACAWHERATSVRGARSAGATSMARAAFIGLGVMGFPMAGHRPGQGPRGDGLQPRTAARPRSGASASAAVARHPARGAAGRRDRVRLRRQRRRPALGGLGRDGILAGLEPAGIFVDHTTASADVARELSRAAAKQGRTSSTRRSPAVRRVPRTGRSRSCAAASRTRSRAPSRSCGPTAAR